MTILQSNEEGYHIAAFYKLTIPVDYWNQIAMQGRVVSHVHGPYLEVADSQ